MVKFHESSKIYKHTKMASVNKFSKSLLVAEKDLKTRFKASVSGMLEHHRSENINIFSNVFLSMDKHNVENIVKGSMKFDDVKSVITKSKDVKYFLLNQSIAKGKISKFKMRRRAFGSDLKRFINKDGDSYFLRVLILTPVIVLFSVYNALNILFNSIANITKEVDFVCKQMAEKYSYKELVDMGLLDDGFVKKITDSLSGDGIEYIEFINKEGKKYYFVKLLVPNFDSFSDFDEAIFVRLNEGEFAEIPQDLRSKATTEELINDVGNYVDSDYFNKMVDIAIGNNDDCKSEEMSSDKARILIDGDASKEDNKEDQRKIKLGNKLASLIHLSQCRIINMDEQEDINVYRVEFDGGKYNGLHSIVCLKKDNAHYNEIIKTSDSKALGRPFIANYPNSLIKKCNAMNIHNVLLSRKVCIGNDNKETTEYYLYCKDLPVKTEKGDCKITGFVFINPKAINKNPNLMNSTLEWNGNSYIKGIRVYDADKNNVAEDVLRLNDVYENSFLSDSSVNDSKDMMTLLEKKEKVYDRKSKVQDIKNAIKSDIMERKINTSNSNIEKRPGDAIIDVIRKKGYDANVVKMKQEKGVNGSIHDYKYFIEVSGFDGNKNIVAYLYIPYFDLKYSVTPKFEDGYNVKNGSQGLFSYRYSTKNAKCVEFPPRDKNKLATFEQVKDLFGVDERSSSVLQNINDDSACFVLSSQDAFKAKDDFEVRCFVRNNNKKSYDISPSFNTLNASSESLFNDKIKQIAY